MLRKRVIVCLDVDGARVVKGVRFEQLRDMGDPVALADRYQRQGADEIVFLDVSASHEGRETVRDVVQRTAECLFIPLTVGGGVRTVGDVEALLRAGADKVAINTAAVRTPELLSQAAERFGAQCVVASVDARPVAGRYEVFTHGGRTATGHEAVAWCRQCVERGAGEVLLTAIDSDGGRAGYDLILTGAVRAAVPVPLVASGGAGAPEHFVQAFEQCNVDAALAAGIFHEGLVEVAAVKAAMRAAGIATRTAPEA